MSIGKDVVELQASIDYRFREFAYLERAMTHSSFSNEKRARGINLPSNERLEFLGDAILEMVISEYLYNAYSDNSEGALTKMRQYLVCEKTLSKVAERLNLGAYLNLGRGEESAGHRQRPKVLADALEALIAAIYLDAGANGYELIKELIVSLFDEEIHRARDMQRGDYKTILQQLVEKDGSSVLEYLTVSETGPEHDKRFSVVAKINNNVVGRGTASTRKDAEMIAAKEALALFGIAP